MNPKERDALRLLEDLLEQIRGIASDAVGFGYASRLGYGAFDPVSACKEIYALAHAAHNFPGLMARGNSEELASIFDAGVQDTLDNLERILGDESKYRLERGLNDKYPTIKDRGLFNELEAYFFEVRQASESRRRRQRHQMALKGVAALMIGTILLSVFKPWSLPIFQGNKIVILDKATAQPATTLIDAAQDMMEKTKPGQVYNVKITVMALPSHN